MIEVMNIQRDMLSPFLLFAYTGIHLSSLLIDRISRVVHIVPVGIVFEVRIFGQYGILLFLLFHLQFVLQPTGLLTGRRIVFQFLFELFILQERSIRLAISRYQAF